MKQRSFKVETSTQYIKIRPQPSHDLTPNSTMEIYVLVEAGDCDCEGYELISIHKSEYTAMVAAESRIAADWDTGSWYKINGLLVWHNNVYYMKIITVELLE